MIAGGCGLIASLGVYQYLRAASDQGETRSVLIAAKEVNINQPLNKDNVQVVSWPSHQIPRDALTQPQQIDGKYARIRLYPGEPILAAKVMNWDDASGSLKVPQGFRAVSVKVTVDSSVSSLIEPGDKVDVIVVLKRSQEAAPMSKTILKAVQVFAVNTEMARSPDKDRTLEELRTVSLLLNPEQAERLAMGQELGTVRLALRSPNDLLVDETPGCTVDRLFGHGGVALLDHAPTPPALASMELPHAAPAPRVPAVTDPADAPPSAGDPNWVMVVESPQAVETYAFDGDNPRPKVDSSHKKLGGKQARRSSR